MVRVDELGPDEGPRLREVRLRALRTDPDAFFSTYEQEAGFVADRWAQRLADPRRASFVAVDPQLGDVGLVGVGPAYDDPQVAEIVAFWVDPRARGRGLAHRLSEAAEAWASAAGFPSVLLYVADANPVAIALYERRGYVPTGVTGTFPPPRQHLTEHARALDLRAISGHGGGACLGRAPR